MYRNRVDPELKDYCGQYLVVKLKNTKCEVNWKQFLENLKSDRGLQSDNLKFREFEKKYNFKWIPTSTTYSKSKTLAESAINTTKKQIIKKSENLGLFAHRNTRLEYEGSPSQLLMRRVVSQILPIHKLKLKPNLAYSKVYQRIKDQK